MKNFLKIIKENKLILDIMNVVIGFIIVILIILLFLNPDKQYLLAIVFLLGVIMNVLNWIRKGRK
ncbi:MAG: hypothetical protein K0S41_352 [Anaerocolumna sp.]|nr:hypothetical protein [Anaerocolumna sp.]